VAWVGRINKDQGDPERPEGDKVAARFTMQGAHLGAGGDLIPARPLVLHQGGQTFETSGTGLVRASVAGNTNTTVVLLWRPGMPVGRCCRRPFDDVVLLAHAHP